MKKKYRVKKNIEFNSIIKNGKFYKNRFYIIYIYNNNLNYSRFGISASTKLGNAVLRNKLKRKMRAIVDSNKKYYQNNLDYIIIMRKACIESDFQNMNSNFIDLIQIINKGDNNEEKK